MKVTSAPTGRKIVQELEREMEDRLYPLFYRTLPPAEYHVYLHPTDYRQIESIVPLIVSDAQQRLSDRVERLNGRGRWSLVSEKPTPIEIPPGGWVIFIQPDPNDEVGAGELGIVSRLAIPAPAAFDGGAPTVRIGRTVVTETIRRSATEIATPGEATASAKSGRTAPSPGADPGASAGFATLTYVDDDGPHLFTMRKASIAIGRGGDAHWVDVQVTSSTRISREHCRIRRDGSGDFFLEDVSTWGTSVNGTRVAPSRRPGESKSGEPFQGFKLPRQAHIDLADALTIEFSAHAEPC
jgi:pSer/pThr/pTyr-binding forkhead associated (FHA) protein